MQLFEYYVNYRIATAILLSIASPMLVVSIGATPPGEKIGCIVLDIDGIAIVGIGCGNPYDDVGILG